MDDGDNAAVTAHAIGCQECGRVWQDPAEHWRVYLTDDEPRQAVAYCPACASREFDGG